MAKLLLYDPDLREYAPFVGQIWGIGGGDQKDARTLKEFANAIFKQKALEEMVLFYHGIPGGIMIGGGVYNLSEKGLRDALPAGKTKIEKIRFEGCWVGEKPDEMAQFGTIFSASEMSGFTWESVRQTISISVPLRSTAETVAGLLKGKERWLAQSMPSANDLVKRAQNGAFSQKILMEWFEPFVSDPIKPPFEMEKGGKRTNFDRLGSHQYKRRSDASQTTIKVKDIEETSIDAISSFEYVTVTA